jgi:O-acetyl-ADP-ribose deacetylase (regulator of RNase III)
MPRIEPYPDTSAMLDISAHDIATVEVDAIVNSAGSSLKGGGGVDGAIHRAAGPALAKACAKLAPCPVGSVRVTNGFQLMTRLIVHTVAPRSNAKIGNPEELLASCYAKSVEAADYFGARTLAVPAIGGGVRGFPLDTVARIAMRACHDQLSKCRFLRHLEFCLTDPAAREAFSKALDDVDRIVPTRADTWEGSYFGEFDFRFIYVAVIEQCRHEWGFLARTPQGQRRVVYASDSGAVLGTLEVASVESARRIVRGRGFQKWGPDTEISSLMPLPWWPLYIPT